MDTLLYEKQKILFRVSLTILKAKEKALLNMRDLPDILPYITSKFIEPILSNEDEFIKAAFAIKLSRKDIKVTKIPLK